jgi:hypothetical protein
LEREEDDRASTMTLTVELPTDLEERLLLEAHRRGLGVEAYALALLGDHLPPADRSSRASSLLRSWIEHGDPDEQKETGEYLIRALDEDRPAERRLFPAALKGVSW